MLIISTRPSNKSSGYNKKSNYQFSTFQHYATPQIIIRSFLLLLLLFCLPSIVDSSNTPSSSLLSRRNKMDSKTSKSDIRIVFSDVDGTLVHYPKDIPESVPANTLLKLPPSSTGMRGIISSKTMQYCREIRKQGIKFALVSGMRTSTLLARLPYLPRADAYCCDAGGRIFYPTNDLNKSSLTFTPEPFDGATKEDLQPFGLVEDMEWRTRMEKITGNFGSATLKDILSDPINSLPPADKREGLLWEFGQSLMAKNYILDVKGYSACFRVNQKQQKEGIISNDDFQALLDGRINPPPGISKSVNLSCIDYYPKESGKKNCCQYLAEKFYSKANKDSVLSNHAVCICDDDNDVEMALACNHAFIPGVSSDSLIETINQNKDHFSQTGGGEGMVAHGTTTSTEQAVLLVLEHIKSN